jgi:hypothetical protein
VIDIGAMTEMVIPLLASDGVTADLMVGDGVEALAEETVLRFLLVFY